MTYNQAMIGFFAVYFLKVPVGIIFYLNANYYGLFLTLVLGTIAEVALFIYANTRPFGK